VKMVNVLIALGRGCLLQRQREPHNVMLENVQIVFYGVGRVISTLQVATKINHHIGHIH
jgi:hypothetical protein